ncbi:MAG: futalosine hydrolase, partial [Frankia sp.]
MSRTRILVVTAVAAERDAVLAAVTGVTGAVPEAAASGARPPVLVPGARVVAVAGGVGWAAGVAAAAELAEAQAAGVPFDAVICAGIAGGFGGRACLGELVVADRVVAAD